MLCVENYSALWSVFALITDFMSSRVFELLGKEFFDSNLHLKSIMGNRWFDLMQMIIIFG